MKKYHTHHLARIIILLLFITGPIHSPTASVQSKSNPQEPPGSYWYYYDGKPVPLSVVPGEAIVGFAAGLALPQGVEKLPGEKATRLSPSQEGLELWRVTNLSSGGDLDERLTRLRSQPGVLFTSPVFDGGKGRTLFYGDRLITKPAEGISLVTLDAAAAKTGLCRDSLLTPELEMWTYQTCTPGGDALSAANRLFETGMVEYADPNFYTEVDFPAITLSEANLQASNWHLNAIHAQEAWVRGNPYIQDPATIAILDTGVKLDHPDLSLKLVGPGISTTGEGGADGSPYAFCPHFHGTAVAGAAAGVTGNNQGVDGSSGLAGWILPVRIATGDCANNGNPIILQEWIITGINWAAERGADVINLSIAGYLSSTFPSQAYRDALSNAYHNYSVVLIAAAGNDSSRGLVMPASDEHVIQVGGTDQNNHRFQEVVCDGSAGEGCGSNYGPAQKIMAPGEGIDVLDLDPGRIRRETGTSLSAPLVAGAAAFLIAIQPSLSPFQVQDILQRTATEASGYPYDQRGQEGGWNEEMGFGLINMDAAVKTLLNPPSLWFTLNLKHVPEGLQAANTVVAILGEYPDTDHRRATRLYTADTSINDNGDLSQILNLNRIAEGDYQVCVKPKHYLWRCLPAHFSPGVLTQVDFTQGGFQFIPGDYNLGGEDGVSNAADLEIFRKNFNAEECHREPISGVCPEYDFDRNGVLNFFDHLYQWQSMNQSGDYIDVLSSYSRPFPSGVINQAGVETMAGQASVTLASTQANPSVGSSNYVVQVSLDLTALPVGAGSTNLIIHYDPGVWNVEDQNSDAPGIQITPSTEVFANSDGGVVNAQRGEINLGAWNGINDEIGSINQGLLASLPLVPIRSISSTLIWAEWQSGETRLSNISQLNDGINQIGPVTNLFTSVSGSPARLLPGVAFEVDSLPYITSCNAPIVMHSTDPFDQVISVQLSVLENIKAGDWIDVGVDDNPADGWMVSWNCLGVADKRVQFKAVATLPGGASGESISQEITLDRTPPRFTSVIFTPSSPAWPAVVRSEPRASDLGGVWEIQQYVNTAPDGSTRGDWVFVGSINPAFDPQKYIFWDTSTFQQGLHRVAFVLRDLADNWSHWEDPGLPVIYYGEASTYLPLLIR